MHGLPCVPYELTLPSAPPLCPRSCCQANLNKIEIAISQKCRSTVRSILINGVERAVSYSNNTWVTNEATPLDLQVPSNQGPGGNYQLPILKVTPIGLSYRNKLGATFGILLPATGECSRLSEYFFGGQLWYAYMNEVELNSGCCGTNTVPFITGRRQ